MTPEEILAKHVFGEDQEMRSLFYMDRFSADLVETNDTIYDAIQEYASQQSAALESENKAMRDALRELVELREMGNKLDAIAFGHKSFDQWTIQQRELFNEHSRRDPLAWNAARKLVKQ